MDPHHSPLFPLLFLLISLFSFIVFFLHFFASSALPSKIPALTTPTHNWSAGLFFPHFFSFHFSSPYGPSHILPLTTPTLTTPFFFIYFISLFLFFSTPLPIFNSLYRHYRWRDIDAISRALPSPIFSFFFIIFIIIIIIVVVIIITIIITIIIIIIIIIIHFS